jgi:hypothetical protein
MSSDITVYIRGGMYPLSSTLTFDAGDSGRNGFNIVYKAFPGEQVRISGGVPVTGWTPVGNGIYKANVGTLQFRQLYINGQRATRARFPKKDNYYHLQSWDTTNKQIQINTSEIANWQRLNEVEMVFQIAWDQTRARIAGFTNAGSFATVTPMEPDGTNMFANDSAGKFAGQTYYFENAYEFLTQPGEWYLNTGTGDLFYMPRTGEDMATAEVIAPKLDTLLKIQGTLDVPVHDLQFYGLQFEHSTWMLASSMGYSDIQAGYFWRPETGSSSRPPPYAMPGAIHIEAADRIRLERNVFRHMGGAGVVLHSGTHNNTLIGNVVTDISGNGIVVDDILVDNPTDPRQVNKNTLISNNFITLVGQDYTGCVGVVAGYTDSLTLEHNEVANTPYTGLSVGWGWAYTDSASRNNLIRYNDIHDVMNLHVDGGGIYTLSKQPGTRIFENYIHDMVASPWVVGLYNTRLYPKGIYLDEGSTYITVEHNVITNIANPHPFSMHDPTLTSDINNDTQDQSVKDNAGLEPAYRDIKL